MQLSAEDLAKLETKQLANIIRKLNSGKTLTAREDAMLARSQASPAAAAAPIPSAFAATWDDLAKALGISRKSLQNWRARPDLRGKLPDPRADGRHDIAAWARAMVEHGLAAADEEQDDDDEDTGALSLAAWKRRREELLCTKLEREIAREDGALLVAADLEVALGQLLAGIGAALNHMPGTAARFLVGIKDPHVMQSRLQSEIDTVLHQLNCARYLEESLVATFAELPFDSETDSLLSRIEFCGQDRKFLIEVITKAAREVLRKIGRHALTDSSRDPLAAAAQQSPPVVSTELPASPQSSPSEALADSPRHPAKRPSPRPASKAPRASGKAARPKRTTPHRTRTQSSP